MILSAVHWIRTKVWENTGGRLMPPINEQPLSRERWGLSFSHHMIRADAESTQHIPTQKHTAIQKEPYPTTMKNIVWTPLVARFRVDPWQKKPMEIHLFCMCQVKKWWVFTRQERTEKMHYGKCRITNTKGTKRQNISASAALMSFSEI